MPRSAKPKYTHKKNLLRFCEGGSLRRVLRLKRANHSVEPFSLYSRMDESISSTKKGGSNAAPSFSDFRETSPSLAEARHLTLRRVEDVLDHGLQPEQGVA